MTRELLGQEIENLTVGNIVLQTLFTSLCVTMVDTNPKSLDHIRQTFDNANKMLEVLSLRADVAITPERNEAIFRILNQLRKASIGDH